jgi:hypothetical protein
MPSSDPCPWVWVFGRYRCRYLEGVTGLGAGGRLGGSDPKFTVVAVAVVVLSDVQVEIRSGQKRAKEDVPWGWEVEAPPAQPIPVTPCRTIVCCLVIIVIFVDRVTLGHTMTQCHQCPLCKQQCS